MKYYLKAVNKINGKYSLYAISRNAPQKDKWIEDKIKSDTFHLKFLRKWILLEGCKDINWNFSIEI